MRIVSKSAAVRIIIFLILFVVFPLAIVNGWGLHSKMTSSRALAMLDNAGGVQKLNEEAKAIFSQYATNTEQPLYGSGLEDYPEVAKLGNAVEILPDSPELPRHIRIRFGPHTQTRFIFIFDPTKPINPNDQLFKTSIYVTSNIFVTK
jgi:hypothetical protein